MRVRVCSRCGTAAYESSARVSVRTVESTEDGEVVDVEDRTLCYQCYVEVDDDPLGRLSHV